MPYCLRKLNCSAAKSGTGVIGVEEDIQDSWAWVANVCTPGINKKIGRSAHKWTALSIGLDSPQCAQMHLEMKLLWPFCGDGLRHIWPHSFSTAQTRFLIYFIVCWDPSSSCRHQMGFWLRPNGFKVNLFNTCSDPSASVLKHTPSHWERCCVHLHEPHQHKLIDLFVLQHTDRIRQDLRLINVLCLSTHRNIADKDWVYTVKVFWVHIWSLQAEMIYVCICLRSRKVRFDHKW